MRFFFFPIPIIIAIVLLINAVLITNNRHEPKVIAHQEARVSPKPPTPTSTPSPTLTPAPTPTPTPVYYGFCLNVPVLLYHHIQPNSLSKEKGQANISVDNSAFDQQMAYLTSHGYTPITAKQLVDALRTKSGLPPKSIVLSFDDGYKDIYDYAFPIFQKYHISVNLMLATGLLGGGDYLSWGQVEEMGRSGLVYFVDHTWSHYALGKGNVDKIKFEIETAKQQIEQHTGQAVNILAYPYGSVGAAATQVLQDDGFLGAFTSNSGYTQCDSFILSLHRNRIGNAPLSYYGL